MTDDEPEQPRRVRVPTRVDEYGFGEPDGDSSIVCDVDVADQWDVRRWRSRP